MREEAVVNVDAGVGRDVVVDCNKGMEGFVWDVGEGKSWGMVAEEAPL